MTCCDDVAKSPSAKLKSREGPVKDERAQLIGLEEFIGSSLQRKGLAEQRLNIYLLRTSVLS